MPRLENWYVSYRDESMYCPPEHRQAYLCGSVYGHNRFEDGKGITTSQIVSGSGNIIYTATGSEYILGEPNQEYVEWCRANNKHVPTKEKPILWIGQETYEIQ